MTEIRYSNRSAWSVATSTNETRVAAAPDASAQAHSAIRLALRGRIDNAIRKVRMANTGINTLAAPVAVAARNSNWMHDDRLVDLRTTLDVTNHLSAMEVTLRLSAVANEVAKHEALIGSSALPMELNSRITARNTNYMLPSKAVRETNGVRNPILRTQSAGEPERPELPAKHSASDNAFTQAIKRTMLAGYFGTSETRHALPADLPSIERRSLRDHNGWPVTNEATAVFAI
jgi:hypothetical protein